MPRPIKKGINGKAVAVRYTAFTMVDSTDDDKRVLYVTDHDTGLSWTEPAHFWELVFDLAHGGPQHYRHKVSSKVYYAE